MKPPWGGGAFDVREDSALNTKEVGELGKEKNLTVIQLDRGFCGIILEATSER
jgi:hypothetical protein